jgi:hypothetical protein
VNATFSVYRLSELEIPAASLCTANTIPNGTGGTQTASGSYYQQPNQ